jgi:hypothetical protein
MRAVRSVKCAVVQSRRRGTSLREPGWLHHNKKRSVNFRARMTNDERPL